MRIQPVKGQLVRMWGAGLSGQYKGNTCTHWMGDLAVVCDFDPVKEYRWSGQPISVWTLLQANAVAVRPLEFSDEVHIMFRQQLTKVKLKEK